MASKKSDSKIISVLVIALLLQIIALLWHMEIIRFGPANKTLQNRQQLAGKIIYSKNKLKRRPLNSLIWEPSQPNQSVYFYDSIMTLSQSSAEIHLNNDTEIQLAENTLIRIEPPTDETTEEIKIFFTKGKIKSRNPYQKTKLQDKEISLEIKKGSSVAINKKSDQDYEIILNEGSATLEKNDKKFEIAEKQILKLSNSLTEKINLSSELTWLSPSGRISYTHSDKATVNLRWQGHADQLILVNPSQTKKLTVAGKEKIEINLAQGEYRAYLANQDKESGRIDILVWQAPMIHLVSPLPRNRVEHGSIEFLWTPHGLVTSYEFRLNSNGQTERKPTNDSKLNYQFNNDQDIEWEVWGYDENKNPIPPPYSYPLFIRKNPFGAPKLNKPKLLQPKQKPPKTSWLNLFFNRAWAASSKQAEFSWEVIAGAEIYHIEIADSLDFRKPVVKQTLTKNNFKWQVTGEDKTYYWRVAAGDNSGRMGIFSEPVKVEFVIAAEKPESTKVAAVEPKTKTNKPLPLVKILPKPDEKSSDKEESKPKNTESPEELKFFDSTYIAFHPGYSFKNFSEGSSTKAELSGTNGYSIALELKLNFDSGWSLLGIGKYNSNTYEPTPKNRFPFQPNIETEQVYVQAIMKAEDSNWGYGAIIVSYPDIDRVGLEQIKVSDKKSLGGVLHYSNEFWTIKYRGLLGVMSGDYSLGFYTSHNFRRSIYWESLIAGVEIESYYFTQSPDSSTLHDFSIILGFEF